MDAQRGERRDRIASTLADYWERLRGDRIAPRRSELDPSQFTHALAHMFILEDVAHGPVRFRLTGSDLGRILGLELRGMPMRAIFEATEATRIEDILRDALDHPASIDLTVTTPHAEGTLILRPLTDDFGSFSRLFGCIIFDDDASTEGASLAIKSVRFQPLTENTLKARPISALGFAEAQAPFAPASHLRAVPGRGTLHPTEAKAPKLRVISQDD